MAAQDRRGFDGTTGTGQHGGYRTRVIQLLRDSPVPVSVQDVADAIGATPGIARYHLESVADAGMADRVRQERTTRGRPKVLYQGTLPSQTHERAQGYRLLGEALTCTLAAGLPDPAGTLYEVGRAWGARLVYPTAATAGPVPAVVAKLEALWFAPEPLPDGTLLLHHCPFTAAVREHPEAVRAVHRGLLDGALHALGAAERVVEMTPLDGDHGWTVRLAREHQDRASAPGRA
ncbi:helix-turn-helix transcriptional regulator [Cellulomonas hominis]|uniref:helix-turn-helix transcriptional regulator n=1 Tax=Cellulomonas hominis TaxID=156981 RepID=UPI00144423A3|nr:hypothetical protein [Cellulomonas hominis]NKY09544.1 hypothetical protein [Cellulomonas hominis]